MTLPKDKKIGESWEISAHPNGMSAFFADCDRDCDNIDLTLKSADGNVIKADTEDDDSPMFSWRATRTGNYTLSVAIPGCHTASGCKYSGQVFVGNRDIFAD